jgi:DNA-binding GntR family transcriptional regulator
MTRAQPDDSSISPLAGIVLNPPGHSPVRGAMPEAVATALREAILDGLLEPGTWLREAEVARELKVSRTPVRDALRILSGESLVELKANQGAVVSAMTIDDIVELYFMRAGLEAMATRLAARRRPAECAAQFAELIPQMQEAGEAQDFHGLSRLNFRFHEIICAAAGNRYLQRSLSQVQNAARRFPDPTFGLPGRVAESLAEHQALADAICRADVDTAETLASSHIRHLSELRIRMLLGN